MTRRSYGPFIAGPVSFPGKRDDALTLSLVSKDVSRQLDAGFGRRRFLSHTRANFPQAVRARRRSVVRTSSPGQRVATYSRLSANLVRCRHKPFATARQVLADFTEPSPIRLHANPPSYGSNRNRRLKAWRSPKQTSRYSE